jgi:toxin FitB
VSGTIAEGELLTRFSGRILCVDARVAERWGLESARAAIEERPIPVIDGLLAATALTHGMILVTRNTADVERMGVRLLVPSVA